jgi:hypothetical protein
MRYSTRTSSENFGTEVLPLCRGVRPASAYARLESAVLTFCDKEGISPAEFDTLAWRKWAQRRSQRGGRHQGVASQHNTRRPTTDYGDIANVGKIIIVKDGSEIRTVNK